MWNIDINWIIAIEDTDKSLQGTLAIRVSVYKFITSLLGHIFASLGISDCKLFFGLKMDCCLYAMGRQWCRNSLLLILKLLFSPSKQWFWKTILFLWSIFFRLKGLPCGQVVWHTNLYFLVANAFRPSKSCDILMHVGLPLVGNSFKTGGNSSIEMGKSKTKT